MYLVAARPILKSRARSWVFLLLVGVATLGSLVLFYTKDVTVKLLPFDNKSELQVVADLPEGSSVEDTARVLGEVAQIALTIPDVHSVQTYAGEPTPFNFNGLVRHYYIRNSPELGDVQITLAGKEERDRTSHQVALELREKLKALTLPEGTSLKVVEPPPGPPVLATLLAEIYGPDAETRRATAAKVREAFASVPFVVDIDDSYGQRMPRIRIAIDQDNLEYQKVEESDVYDTLQSLYAENTVGYSHRGGGRQPIPITLGLPKSERIINERSLSTPVPANALPGGRGVVELGDVVSVDARAVVVPAVPAQRQTRRDGDRRTRRFLRGACLRHDRSWQGHRCHGLDRAAEAGRSRFMASPSTIYSQSCCGMASGR